jgi:ectoine hydroxylase-related dioxygenase (phytanoyl-CoA dioxygenase family)
VNHLEKQGFAIVLDVLPKSIMEEVIVDIRNHFKGGDSRGHALRHLVQAVPTLRKLAEGSLVESLVEPHLGSGAFLVRSLFFDKTPDANWKVAWHQDLTIAVREKIEVSGFTPWSLKEGVQHVQPPASILERMLTVRLHLDDCDAANGPLQVIPGSHKSGRLTARQISKWRRQSPPIICTVPRGGAVVMRPLLVHASSPAVEPKHRRVVHLEFAAESLPGGLSWL